MSDLICTCGCANRGPHAYHFTGCPMADHPDSLKAKLKVLEMHLAHNSKALSFWLKERQFWEGKYRIVKHENNQLRKKLYPPTK